MCGTISVRRKAFRRFRDLCFLLGFLSGSISLAGQQRLGGSLEGGFLQTLLTNGAELADEGNPAFGMGLWWAPGDLLVKPAFLTDGNNHAAALSIGARFYQRLGLSGRVTFLRDHYDNLFLDNQQELQALERNQWFVLFGAELSYFPGLREETDRNSWILSAGFSYLNGGTFLINAGVGYVWKIKDREGDE